MNLETTTLFLTPLLFYMSWSVFVFSFNTVMSLIALLLSSLGLPLIFMSSTKTFWPCGLFLILMSTGLIVIFAYIVSLHPKGESGNLGLLSALLFSGGLMSLGPASWSFQKVYQAGGDISVSPLLSLLLILVLLLLVVAFIRVVYSKGGGFRKKF